MFLGSNQTRHLLDFRAESKGMLHSAFLVSMEETVLFCLQQSKVDNNPAMQSYPQRSHSVGNYALVPVLMSLKAYSQGLKVKTTV